MPLNDFLLRLLGIARTIQGWHAQLLALDVGRRDKLAVYADEIAATFARAAAAFSALDRIPYDQQARRDAIRELGRLSGYLDDVVSVLDHGFDGRKLSGLKRRLGRLGVPRPSGLGPRQHDGPRLDTLLDAEGYFRALADGLRAR